MEVLVEKREEITYVSREEMQEIDRQAIEQHGIPSLTLMENAGKAIAEEVKKSYKTSCPIIVVCGKGKNGGDGIVAARHLYELNYKIIILWTCMRCELDSKSDTFINMTRIDKISAIITHENGNLSKILQTVGQKGVLIDAILGIGLDRDVNGKIQDIIVEINNLSGTRFDVIAADIPSGLDADTGLPRPVAVKCKKTVTMGFPKLAFKNPDAKIYTGEVIVADIGLPKELN